MNTGIKGEKIYLDANFLIYWFASKEPMLRKRARYLLAELSVNKNELYSSPLAFDEAWWGVKNEYNKQNHTNLSCSASPLFEKLENFTKAVLQKIEVIQFCNVANGIMDSLSNIKKFDFKPRDAFHLAVMKDNNIGIIATDDDDFMRNERLVNISVVSVL